MVSKGQFIICVWTDGSYWCRIMQLNFTFFIIFHKWVHFLSWNTAVIAELILNKAPTKWTNVVWLTFKVLFVGLATTQMHAWQTFFCLWQVKDVFETIKMCLLSNACCCGQTDMHAWHTELEMFVKQYLARAK